MSLYLLSGAAPLNILKILTKTQSSDTGVSNATTQTIHEASDIAVNCEDFTDADLLSIIQQKYGDTVVLQFENIISNLKRKPNGRRYDKKSKKVALQLYEASPKMYKMYRSEMQLPCPSTLQLIKQRYADKFREDED